MSDSEDRISAAIIRKEDEVKKSYLDELIEVGNQVSTILMLGLLIENFANHTFNLYLSEDTSKIEDLRSSYTEFFMNPKPIDQAISSEMKAEIEKVLDLKDINDVVDRFCKIYLAYCTFLADRKLEDYYDQGNIDAFRSLLVHAPEVDVEKDGQLRKIIATFLLRKNLSK